MDDIEEYYGRLDSLRNEMMDDIQSAMLKALPPIVSSTPHAIENGFFLDTILTQLGIFWNAQMDYQEPPFKFEVKDGTIPGSKVTFLNGKSVWWSIKQDELNAAFGAFQDIWTQVFVTWNEKGDTLVDRFYKANQDRWILETTLQDFITYIVVPMRKSIQDEGYLEGKCDRCITVGRAIRRFVRL